MPVNNGCIVTQIQNCVAGSPTDQELVQMAGAITSIEAGDKFSVACTVLLPDACDNTGRWVYVTDIGAYRYSNGQEWTNSYDTTSTNYGSIYSTGSTLLEGFKQVTSPTIYCDFNSDWKQVTSTFYSVSSAALKSDSTLWGWGFNTCGLLGVGDATVKNFPTQEITSSTWLCISSTGEDMLGIKCDGTLWGSGRNIATLGDGTAAARSSPVQELCSDSTWCHIGAGGRNVAAIKSSGTLWTWGCNGAGEVGGTCSSILPTRSPVQEVSLSSNWAFSAAGSETLQNHIIGIKSDGTAWLWGMNDFGHLGVNSKVCYSSPVQEISLSTNWCTASLGTDFSLGLKTDGTLWAWGKNDLGQLGVNNTVSYSSPIQEITSSTNWSILSSSGCLSASLKIDNTLWAWGTNLCYQLGDGTNICRSSPVQEITSSTSWCNTVSTGACTIVAINQETKGFNEP